MSIDASDPAALIALVERHLVGELERPPGMFEVTLLPGLDLPRHRFAIAAPRGMSRGGEVPFVITLGPAPGVTAGNRQALEEIVRSEGLGAGLSVERFVALFFLMVVVGRGGPVAPPVVRRVGDGVEISAVTGDGIERAPVTHTISVGPDGSIRSSEG